MSSKDKALKNMKNNPKNISFEELKKVLEQNGFVLDRIKGSHHTFYRGNQTLTIPYNKPIKAIYVKLVLSAILGE
ncbi:hypothetical protein BKH46_05465 [Helicobacter sp. 12S02634-8]|uniref:type II toxin-antitoxin system HicA family toxin n=1 Tax=Helicobacter sp. 12S02634-8 TaxID=1476199 RepID=UPI000BA69F4B|nr:type II toxin-antitoxin system HicA family toxin [Helicobacter sp. 12S02634-8]PAF47155.1 hypothetical protein BKH46_05465 [Helicobacter sp. 12S02634-8]